MMWLLISVLCRQAGYLQFESLPPSPIYHCPNVPYLAYFLAFLRSNYAFPLQSPLKYPLLFTHIDFLCPLLFMPIVP